MPDHDASEERESAYEATKTQTRRPPKKEPTWLRIPLKCWLGGVGGAATVLANLLLLQAAQLDKALWAIWNEGLQGLDAEAYLLGNTARALMLFFVGAGWLALHSTPRSHLQTFQLGMVAPALFLAYIAGANQKM